MSKNVWILAEQRDGKVLDVSFELLTRGIKLAEKLGVKLIAVLFGEAVSDDECNRLIERGADGVICAEAPQLATFLPEPYTACLCDLIKREQPDIMLAAATTTGRTVMPCTAARLRAGLTADCTNLDIEEGTGLLLQTRPAAGGNIMATIKTPDRRPQMATVRPHSERPAPVQAGRKGDIIRWKPEAKLLASHVKRVGYEAAEQTMAIQDADIVVSVGRGFKKGENVVHSITCHADCLAMALEPCNEHPLLLRSYPSEYVVFHDRICDIFLSLKLSCIYILFSTCNTRFLCNIRYSRRIIT